MKTLPKKKSTKPKIAHTPPPWGVSSLFFVCDHEARILANCARTGVPSLDVPFDERVANARVMALAPEMLDLLRKVESYGVLHLNGPIRELLAKAEGK